MAERARTAYLPWTDAPPPARLPSSCGACGHYRADPIHPPAGAGHCSVGHGTHYPMQRHWCRDHKEQATP